MLDNQLIALIISILTAGETAAGIPSTPIAQSFQPTMQGVNTQPTVYLHKISDHRYGFRGQTDVWQPVQSASFTGSISGTVLNVSAVTSGNINVGDQLAGPGIGADVLISSNGSGTGGVGTYNISESLSISSEPMTTATLTMVHTETQQYETTFQISTLAAQNPATPSQLTASDIANLCAYIMQSAVAVQTLEAQGVGIERITEVRNPYFMDDRDQFEASPSFDFILTHKQIITTTTPVAQSLDLQMYRV